MQTKTARARKAARATMACQRGRGATLGAMRGRGSVLEHQLLPAHSNGLLPGQRRGLHRLPPGQVPRREAVPVEMPGVVRMGRRPHVGPERPLQHRACNSSRGHYKGHAPQSGPA